MAVTRRDLAMFQELQENAEFQVFNLLLTALTEFADWDEDARPWLGIAGDVAAEVRLSRADMGNFLMTRIEAEIQHAQEGIAYEKIQYFTSSGREAENHLVTIDMYNHYIQRLKLAKKNVWRIVALVWPLPKMLRAALTDRRESGTRSVMSASQVRSLQDTVARLGDSGDAPAPTEEEAEDVETETESDGGSEE